MIKPVNCPAKKKEDCVDPQRLSWSQCWYSQCRCSDESAEVN